MKKTLILAFALLASLLALSSCNKNSDSEKDDDANKTKIVLEIDELDLGHPVTNADAKSAANAIRNRLRGLDLKNLKVTTDDDNHIVVTTTDTENIERAVELAQRSTYVAFCPTFKKYEINFKPILHYIDSIGDDPQACAAREFLESGNGPYAYDEILGYVKNDEEFDEIFSFFQRPEVRSLLPEELVLCRSYKESEAGYQVYMLKSPSDGYDMLFGDVITSAEVNKDSQYGYEVYIRMNDQGSREWKNITNRNKGRAVAIVVEDKIMCAPYINSEIVGGKASITGEFDRKEAQDIANKLMDGTLRARLKVVSADRPK